MTIVKVQRPIAGEPSGIMIYAEGHEHLEIGSAESLPNWLIAALERTPKIYAHAERVNGQWAIKSRAPWQDW